MQDSYRKKNSKLSEDLILSHVGDSQRGAKFHEIESCTTYKKKYKMIMFSCKTTYFLMVIEPFDEIVELDGTVID